MGASSKFLPKPKRSSPISVIEFANALISTWRAARSYQNQAATIGLAVSGGVDSMALASVCSQIQQTPYLTLRTLLESEYGQNSTGTPLSRNVRFQAFVVDHGVREGSSLEARAVSKVLIERNISTQILKIDWAGYERVEDLPNFESLARKYRFQALGKACKEHGISSLFLAHHEDDQVETIMMRLMSGHRTAGLMGIQPISEIPECYGLHGVHESGGIDIPIQSGRRGLTSTSLLQVPATSKLLEEPIETEFGGVRIYRPLLQFNKERLIATCQKERMRWFEDHTNMDPTITMRNAIRHMYRYHSLPAALSKSALLKLSRTCRMKQSSVHGVVSTWLSKCSITLETRVGTLWVRFADLNHVQTLPGEVDYKYSAAILLRHIVKLVTPQEHVNVSSLVGAVERLFPERFWTRESLPPTTTFTVAGLQFKHDASDTLKTRASSEKPKWLISRQPSKSTATKPKIVIPALQDFAVDPPWSPWNLYDGRFWIRVQNMMAATIIIRSFHEQDMMSLKNSWSKPDKDRLRRMLIDLAPGGIRWTLPAIVMQGLNGKEKLLALPTLRVGAPNIEKIVQWEVRYKKVDSGEEFANPSLL